MVSCTLCGKAPAYIYLGMLDNTVGGGIATGEDRFESLVREAQEEASLPEALVRENVSYHGTVTYTYIRESRAGGESGLVQPECEYIYDLELPADVLPKPNDSEVEEFYLWTVDEIQERMAKGEFKPNCALIMLDFFIRHGILTKENEKNYDEIQRRLHRDLGLPGPHNE
jgi:8-oxo-dGTP pyrophosphatase MutT (NUDIX family)